MIFVLVTALVVYLIALLFYDLNKRVDNIFTLSMPILIVFTLLVSLSIFHSGGYRSNNYEVLDVVRLETFDGSYVTNKIPRDGMVTVHTEDGDTKIKTSGIRRIANSPSAEYATMTTIRESRVPEWIVWPLNNTTEGYILEIDDSSKMSVDPLRHVR